MYKSKYQNLIEHLTNEHDLILLDSEIQEIENIIKCIPINKLKLK